MKLVSKTGQTRIPPTRRRQGFTLIELLVTVSIVALLALLVAPSFQDTIRRNQRLSAIETFSTALAAARSEATARGTPVSLCPTADNKTCSGTAWDAGILIFSDDGAGAGVAYDMNLTGDEERIKLVAPLPGSLTVRSANFSDAGGIVFNPRGMLEQRGSVVVCDKLRASYAQALVLNRSGQPRLAIDENADSIVNDDKGVNVTCP